MPTYIHTYIHTYMDTNIHTHIHAYLPTYTYMDTNIHTHTYMDTYIHTYVRTFIHTGTYEEQGAAYLLVVASSCTKGSSECQVRHPRPERLGIHPRLPSSKQAMEKRDGIEGGS
jgi:hypothetical protein